MHPTVSQRVCVSFLRAFSRQLFFSVSLASLQESIHTQACFQAST